MISLTSVSPPSPPFTLFLESVAPWSWSVTTCSAWGRQKVFCLLLLFYTCRTLLLTHVSLHFLLYGGEPIRYSSVFVFLAYLFILFYITTAISTRLCCCSYYWYIDTDSHTTTTKNPTSVLYNPPRAFCDDNITEKGGGNRFDSFAKQSYRDMGVFTITRSQNDGPTRDLSNIDTHIDVWICEYVYVYVKYMY